MQSAMAPQRVLLLCGDNMEGYEVSFISSPNFCVADHGSVLGITSLV